MTRKLLIAALLILGSFAPALNAANPIVVSGCGDVATRVSEFRSLLGAPLNGTSPGPQPTGRREINWDGVPATVTNNNTFPTNFFNANSTRGLLLSTPGTGLRVSDNNFTDVNTAYGAQFTNFSPAKTFSAVGSNIVDVTFQVSASQLAAGTSAFGAVFSDVDTAGSTTMEFFNGSTSLGRFTVPTRCDATGLSFLGVAFTDGRTATRVRITAGSAALGASTADVSAGGAQDLVVMDDFLYAEPYANGTLFTAVLSGANEVPPAGNGSGVAVVTIDANTNTVTFAESVQGIDAPTASHIHRGAAGVNGPVVVDLHPTFTNGVAFGAVTIDSALAAEILANPSNFYVNVHNAAFPAGAARGQLVAAGTAGATRTVIPIAGRVAGANNTLYRTDVRVVNRSGAPMDVLAQYYASGGTSSTPTATATFTIANGEQRALDDVTKTLFNSDSGTGAIVFIAPRALNVTARIYNDQTALSKGTFGQFVPGFTEAMAVTSGTLPFLGNQPAASGAGTRTNIGWFNPGSGTVAITLTALSPAGAVLATTTQSVAPFSQSQTPLTTLFPTLAAMDNLYVTFTTSGGPLDVYASVVDNVSGDPVFIPAQ